MRRTLSATAAALPFLAMAGEPLKVDPQRFLRAPSVTRAPQAPRRPQPRQ